MVESTEQGGLSAYQMNLLSRQIGTFGMEAMGKLIKLKVLIIGMRGLGVETAKNLILAGPAQVHLYDPTPVAIEDLSANFYLTEEHVGKVSRAAGSVTQLSELNGYCKTDVIETFAPADVANYDCICVTENMNGFESLVALDAACREAGKGFILAETLGAAGYVFVDFGDHHKVFDMDGEPTKQFVISKIDQGVNPVVMVHEDKRHSYQDGDYVKFVEVEGMTELNGHEPIKIKDCKGFQFTLDFDSSKFSTYTAQGIVENIKLPTPIPFHSLAQSVKAPAQSSPDCMLPTPDMRFWGRANHSHAAVRGVHAFHSKHGRYPTGDNEAELEECLEYAKGFWPGLSMDEDEALDATVAKDTARFARNSLSCQSAFFGGIVAQEIVKYTGKYAPLRQWLHYDILESVPKEANRQPKGCRYDDQIRVYGQEVQDKLGAVKTFMIGAGALGCELIKGFACMGLGCGPEGSVTVTDNDNIEISNLNRQFLFRTHHVGKPKSVSATSVAQGMNKDLKVRADQLFVAPITEDTYDDKFWEGLDFVVNAVDNVKARQYVDDRCVWFQKPLLESGTLGTKANSQMIVPHKSLTYNDIIDPPEESIPMCTMRNFPSQIEHCIEWGRDKFNGIFTDVPADAVAFLENQEKWMTDMKKNRPLEIPSVLLKIKSLIELKKTANFQQCMQVARDMFTTDYDHNIRDLLSLFPADHKDDQGNVFWSGPKRCPNPLPFNPEDALSYNYVVATANLIAFNLGIKQVTDEAALKASAAATKPSKYVPKTIKVDLEEGKKKEGEPEEQKQEAPAELDESEEDMIIKLMAELSLDATHFQGEGHVIPADFEKDDDDNFHIAFIHAAANGRATNYRIAECTHHKTKMIAGKIIPAIATTTAMITGAVLTEVFKYVQGFQDLEQFKNAFINLAVPMFLMTEPEEIKTNKSGMDPIMYMEVVCVPEGWTKYDKVVIDKGSLTLGQFLDHMVSEEKLTVEGISCDPILMYNAIQASHANRRDRVLEELYTTVSQKEITKNYLILQATGVTADGDDFSIPPIQYIFK